MSYWVVMAIVVIAIIAVMIAIELEPDEPDIVGDDPEGRPIWVALGSSALAPLESANPHWAELVRQEFGDQLIAYDFTRFGATADEIQRDSLEAALAAKPDIVTLLIGPDDFRDAENLNVFERRLWHILTTLTKVFATPVLTTLPDLATLPSLAAEDDVTVLTEERGSWNVAITRLCSVAQAELVDVETVGMPAEDLLWSEASGRFVLTDAGQRWFASLMIDRLHLLLDDAPSTTGESIDAGSRSIES